MWWWWYSILYGTHTELPSALRAQVCPSQLMTTGARRDIWLQILNCLWERRCSVPDQINAGGDGVTATLGHHEPHVCFSCWGPESTQTHNLWCLQIICTWGRINESSGLVKNTFHINNQVSSINMFLLGYGIYKCDQNPWIPELQLLCRTSGPVLNKCSRPFNLFALVCICANTSEWSKSREVSSGWRMLCVFSCWVSSRSHPSWGIFLWLLHSMLQGREEESLQRFSAQFHDGFREEASQAFQVAEQREGSIVEESR